MRSLLRAGSQLPALRFPLAWLLGLGIVLFLRFPVNFTLYPPFCMDFETYRYTALRVRDGKAAQLYEPTTSERMVFKYAPCWAVAVAPFGWLSDHAGAVLWSGFNVLWLLLTCWMSERLCRLIGLRAPPFLAILAVLSLARPITSEHLLGQADLLWGVLLVAFLYCEATTRPWWAALWLALAASLKLPALLWIPYLLLMRRGAVVLRTIVWLLALNVIAAWLLVPAQPFSLFAAWHHALVTSGMTYAFDISNQSFMALAGRLLRNDHYGLNLLVLPDQAVAFLTLAIQALLFGALVFPRRLPTTSTSRLILDGALLMVFMVLFSPSGWLATYSALLFPSALTLALFLQRPQMLTRRLSWALGAVGLLVFSALMNAKLWHALGVKVWRGESYVYLVFMIPTWLGLSMAWSLWHQRRALTYLT